MNRAQHRAAIAKTPVILVHGNGANSAHPKWGWQQMVALLKAIGYQDSEIWAMDYLGENNDQAELPSPHTNHIDEFREFVDQIIAYLAIDRIDFIAHSLGCGMVNGYPCRMSSSERVEENTFSRLTLVSSASDS